MDKLIEQFTIHLNENYNAHKNAMMKCSKEEIFSKAYLIHFYECLNDYLSQYEWEDSVEHKDRLSILYDIQNIFNSIWSTYIKNEWLGYTSWEEIDDLMCEFYRQNRAE